ncbi:hypothetical protein HTG_15575 [Natrinema mahii]|nr:hypothetical protein HTG_15575 [Natrinema mahii]
MRKRRTVLRTCASGFTLGIAAVGSGAAQSNDECDGCSVEVVSETEQQKIVDVSIEGETYRYRIDKKSTSVHLIEANPRTNVGTQQVDTDLEILQETDPWGDTLGEYSFPSVTKYEVGVAAVAGEDIGQAVGGAIGGVICAALPGAGWGAAGVCGAIGSVIIDFDTAGDEFTVGLWDEASDGPVGTPQIRIGTAAGHEYSHEDLEEAESVPGYLALADPSP